MNADTVCRHRNPSWHVSTLNLKPRGQLTARNTAGRSICGPHSTHRLPGVSSNPLTGRHHRYSSPNSASSSESSSVPPTAALSSHFPTSHSRLRELLLHARALILKVRAFIPHAKVGKICAKASIKLEGHIPWMFGSFLLRMLTRNPGENCETTLTPRSTRKIKISKTGGKKKKNKRRQKGKTKTRDEKRRKEQEKMNMARQKPVFSRHSAPATETREKKKKKRETGPVTLWAEMCRCSPSHCSTVALCLYCRMCIKELLVLVDMLYRYVSSSPSVSGSLSAASANVSAYACESFRFRNDLFRNCLMALQCLLT